MGGCQVEIGLRHLNWYPMTGLLVFAKQDLQISDTKIQKVFLGSRPSVFLQSFSLIALLAMEKPPPKSRWGDPRSKTAPFSELLDSEALQKKKSEKAFTCQCQPPHHWANESVAPNSCFNEPLKYFLLKYLKLKQCYSARIRNYDNLRLFGSNPSFFPHQNKP